MNNVNLWNIATYIYIILLFLTFCPVLEAILNKIELHDGGKSFKDTQYFDEKNIEKLANHYSRIMGTLAFWKNQALKFKRFHYYVLCWTIPSSVIIPIAIQYSSDNNGPELFLTVVSTTTALLLAFHQGFKVEDNFKSYRHGESDFFDTYRRLLDRPSSFGDTQEEQIEQYFKEVETIRRYIRNAETNNLATLDSSSKQYENLQSKKSQLSKKDNHVVYNSQTTN